MKTVLFSGVAAAGLLFSASTAGAADSDMVIAKSDAASTMQLEANGRKMGGGMKPGMGMPKPHMGGMKPGMGMPKPHMGGMKPGGHHIGFKPRPGFHGIPKTDVYRRPHRGFILPRYWVQPSFYLSNFGSYGLSSPSNGYYWSRYYDDAVLTDNRGNVQDYRSDVNWGADNYGGPDRTTEYREPEYGPSMRPDTSAYNWNDDVAFAAPDGSSYSYDGDWDGEYVDPQGRVFEGDWSGTVTRHDGVEGPGYPAAPARKDSYYTGPPERIYSESYTGPPERVYSQGYTGPPERGYSDRYDVPRGYEGYERCLKSNGVTGGVIGAILGGVAGNRIAGRGDRLGGSLIGAGLGGLAGVAIEKAMGKCKRHEPRSDVPPRGPYYPPQSQYPQHHGWQGGYYYYPQAPMVTVTVVPGSSHTTTTVTEEVYYETVKTYPRKKAVRKWKPKPKPRCGC